MTKPKSWRDAGKAALKDSSKRSSTPKPPDAAASGAATRALKAALARKGETALDRKLKREFEKLGYEYIKLAPTVAGMPDRLLLTPAGIRFLELKSNTGKLRTAQIALHERWLKKFGIKVEVMSP